MAVLSGPAVLASAGGSGAARWAVLSFQKASAADTFDCSTLTAIAPFSTVYGAIAIAATNRTETITIAGVSGTVVTVAGTGISNDAILMFVVGT